MAPVSASLAGLKFKAEETLAEGAKRLGVGSEALDEIQATTGIKPPQVIGDRLDIPSELGARADRQPTAWGYALLAAIAKTSRQDPAPSIRAMHSTAPADVLKHNLGAFENANTRAVPAHERVVHCTVKIAEIPHVGGDIPLEQTILASLVDHISSRISGSNDWKITMAGGSENGVAQKRYKGRSYYWVLAERLCDLKARQSKVTFEYKRPDGVAPTPANDRSFLLVRETGQVVSVDNAYVNQVEKDALQRLGPEFTRRFRDANMVPYVHPDPTPVVFCYKDGGFTGATFAVDDKVGPAMESLRDAYVELWRKLPSVPEERRRLLLGPSFIQLLEQIVPDNDYLINRCRNEASMLDYMQEELLKFWEETKADPSVALEAWS